MAFAILKKSDQDDDKSLLTLLSNRLAQSSGMPIAEVNILVHHMLRDNNEIIESHLKDLMVTSKLLYSDAISEYRSAIRQQQIDSELSQKHRLASMQQFEADQQSLVEQNKEDIKFAHEQLLEVAYETMLAFDTGVYRLTPQQDVIRHVLSLKKPAYHVGFWHDAWFKFIYRFNVKNMTASEAMKTIGVKDLLPHADTLGVSIPEKYERRYHYEHRLFF